MKLLTKPLLLALALTVAGCGPVIAPERIEELVKSAAEAAWYAGRASKDCEREPHKSSPDCDEYESFSRWYKRFEK